MYLCKLKIHVIVEKKVVYRAINVYLSKVVYCTMANNKNSSLTFEIFSCLNDLFKKI